MIHTPGYGKIEERKSSQIFSVCVNLFIATIVIVTVVMVGSIMLFARGVINLELANILFCVGIIVLIVTISVGIPYFLWKVHSAEKRLIIIHPDGFYWILREGVVGSADLSQPYELKKARKDQLFVLFQRMEKIFQFDGEDSGGAFEVNVEFKNAEITREDAVAFINWYQLVHISVHYGNFQTVQWLCSEDLVWFASHSDLPVFTVEFISIRAPKVEIPLPPVS